MDNNATIFAINHDIATIRTCRSHMRTCPARQPEASRLLEMGWKAMDQGVRG